MSSSQQIKFAPPPKEILAFHSLSIYKNLAKNQVFSSLYKLLTSLYAENTSLIDFIDCYNDFFHIFISNSHLSLKEYVIECTLFDENPFSKGVENGLSGRTFIMVEATAAKDLDNLQLVSNVSSYDVKNSALKAFSSIEGVEEIIGSLPSWDIANRDTSYSDSYSSSILNVKRTLLSSNKWSDCMDVLKSLHRNYGTGEFCKHVAFMWEYDGTSSNFRGIDTPDPISFADLIEYEAEREVVIKNTLQFLSGYKANNVLLYGDRGTGKSSTVKALLNEYWKQGLRIIEVPKSRLVDFPKIARLLKNRKQKFIIFVDDLAFEDNEENYTALKAILEGGVESKPENVLIYATSNRRHLVKEKFSDRAGLQYGTPDDEVRAMDSIQEKLSLADRFGITVVFSSPDKKRFLQIVEGIVEQRGIRIDKEQLHKEALKWEVWYNGRSPRTARQFVDWLEGEMAK